MITYLATYEEEEESYNTQKNFNRTYSKVTELTK